VRVDVQRFLLNALCDLPQQLKLSKIGPLNHVNNFLLCGGDAVIGTQSLPPSAFDETTLVLPLQTQRRSQLLPTFAAHNAGRSPLDCQSALPSGPTAGFSNGVSFLVKSKRVIAAS
jgi:hypothetical protein